DLAIALERDGDGEVRYAVQEIGRAVERVDDPAMPAVAGDRLRSFLAEEAEARTRQQQPVAQDALCLQVGAADEVARTFGRHLEILDLAEIALQALGGLERGADHHRDDGRTRCQRTDLGTAAALAARVHGCTDDT